MSNLTSNRLTRRKQLQKDDAYHKANLQAIRTKHGPFFKPSPTAVLINHSKKAQLKEVRDREIERENRSLLMRIDDIRGRRGGRSLGERKGRKRWSLNEGARQRMQEVINLENMRFVESLSSTSPTLDLEKIRKDWAHTQKVMLTRSKNKSNMTEFFHAVGSPPMTGSHHPTLQPLHNPETSNSIVSSEAKLVLNSNRSEVKSGTIDSGVGVEGVEGE